MAATTETPFIVHHLTDIHIGPLHYEAANKGPFVRMRKHPRNISAYLDHLTLLATKQKEQLPDLVVVSGDLTSYATEQEMDAAEDAIKRILSLVKKKEANWRSQGDAPFIFLVPGNHDLDWRENDYKSKINRYARKADALYDGGTVISALYHSPEHPVSWDFGDACNLFVYLFNTTALGGVKDPGLSSIHDSLSSIHQSLKDYYFRLNDPGKIPGDEFARVLKELEKETRKDPGYILPEDLKAMEQLLEKVPEQRFKIAVMHHNPANIPTDDIEAFDTIINAGVVKDYLITNGFDLVLHGHRHFSHCSHEAYLRSSTYPPSFQDLRQGRRQGLFVVGGDTLGCKEVAPFGEVKLYNIENAHTMNFPGCLFEIRKFERDGVRYVFKDQPLVREIVDKQLYTGLGRVLVNLGRKELPSEKPLLGTIEGTIKSIEPALAQLRAQLADWGDESNLWITRFHFELDNYCGIYATDVDRRMAVASPQFEKYLRQQYSARLEKLRWKEEKCLRFSPSVHDAILRTGWTPDKTMWAGYEIEEADEPSARDLEIVRILVRREAGPHDRQELENLDFDHKHFAIPLFVLDRGKLGSDQLIDFAIGVDKEGHIISCFEFEEIVESSGKVKRVERPERRAHLREIFDEMLNNKSLMTVDKFVGHRIMIRNPQRLEKFAKNYDTQGRLPIPSSVLFRSISNPIQPKLVRISAVVPATTPYPL